MGHRVVICKKCCETSKKAEVVEWLESRVSVMYRINLSLICNPTRPSLLLKEVPLLTSFPSSSSFSSALFKRDPCIVTSSSFLYIYTSTLVCFHSLYFSLFHSSRISYYLYISLHMVFIYSVSGWFEHNGNTWSSLETEKKVFRWIAIHTPSIEG